MKLTIISFISLVKKKKVCGENTYDNAYNNTNVPRKSRKEDGGHFQHYLLVYNLMFHSKCMEVDCLCLMYHRYKYVTLGSY